MLSRCKIMPAVKTCYNNNYVFGICISDHNIVVCLLHGYLVSIIGDNRNINNKTAKATVLLMQFVVSLQLLED